MAIDTTVTLKRQIVELNEWATAHPMVNDFGYGQYLEVYKQSGNKYLTLVVNSPTLTSEDFFVNYSWEVICLDYVLDQKDNMQRVLSDTQDVLRDLENTIRYSKRWKEFSRADGNWSYRKVDEFGADKCFGWIATFTLKIKKKHGICDISSLMPTYDFETGSIVYPTCDPVLFAINGTDEDSFASGSDFDLTLVDTDGNVPVYSYDDVLKKLMVQAASGGVASQTYNGAAVTDQDSGTTKAITVKDSANNNIGTKGTDTALALAISVADATQTVNGNAITSQLPETAKSFVIRHANNDPVVVTTVTDTATSFIGEVPDVVVPINTSNLFKTGQTTSYAANDDGDLEFGRGVDFFTLEHNNGFGNTSRFTDDLGGLTYTSNVVVDWSTWNQVAGTVLAFYRVPSTTGATNWTNAMSGQPYTVNSLSSWYVPNVTQHFQLMNWGLSSLLDYTPFNISGTSLGERLWMSNTSNAATTTALSYAGGIGINTTTKTTTCRFILCRTYTLAELGL